MTIDGIIQNSAAMLAADYQSSDTSVSEENGRLPSRDVISQR